MKTKKETRGMEDESLFGLLSSHKANNIYFRILTSEKEDSIVVQIADNPKKWSLIPKNKYQNHCQLKRLHIGTSKLSVKYLAPEHLIKQLGPTLNTKIPSEKYTVYNTIEHNGLFILETTLIFMPEILQNIKKIINLSPQKKYQLLEKCLAEGEG